MREDEPSGFGFGSYRREGQFGGGGGMTALTWIMIANIAVFVLQYGFRIGWIDGGPMSAGGPMGAVSRDALAQGHVWTLITHMFVHGNLLHLGLNLLLIWVAGKLVLRVVGTKHFLGIYFLGGLVGAGAQMAISSYPMVGASGAAFALLVAFGMILWDTQIFALLAFVIPVRLRARYLVLGVVGITVIFALIDLLTKDSGRAVSRIAHMAHLGGALVGYYYSKFLGYPGRMMSKDDLMRQRASNDSKMTRRKEKKKWRSRLSKPRIVETEVVESEDFISKEIDPILEKIGEHGMHSLTEAERKILEKGSKKIASKVD